MPLYIVNASSNVNTDAVAVEKRPDFFGKRNAGDVFAEKEKREMFLRKAKKVFPLK